MQVKVDTEGPCRRALHIAASAEEALPEYNAVLKAYASQARIKGFRPGRAPIAHVERLFARAIGEETKDRLLPRFYREALAQESLTDAMPVEVRDVAFAKTDGLSFIAVVDVPPEFKLPKYAKMTVKSESVAVTDEQVEAALDSIRQSHARFEDPAAPHPVRLGDLVAMDYAGTIDGAPVKTLVPDQPGLSEGSDFWALADEPEFLPGLNAGLVGCDLNEQRQIAIAFPSDYRVADLAGKNAVYDVTIKSIRDRILPEWNEEFLRQFDVATLDELRSKIRDDLLARQKQADRQRMKEDISRQLIEKTRCDLPQSEVEEETRRAARSMVRQIVGQGAAANTLEQQKDRILAAAYKTSADRVKLSYVLERIAAQENISIPDEETDREMQALARSCGMAPNKLREELEKNDGLKRFKRDMLCDRTLDFLVEKATIKS